MASQHILPKQIIEYTPIRAFVKSKKDKKKIVDQTNLSIIHDNIRASRNCKEFIISTIPGQVMPNYENVNVVPAFEQQLHRTKQSHQLFQYHDCELDPEIIVISSQ